MSTDIALSYSTDKHVLPTHTYRILEPNQHKFMIPYFVSSHVMIKYKYGEVVMQT